MKHGKFAIVDHKGKILVTSDDYKKLEALLYKFALDAMVKLVYTNSQGR